MIIETRLDFRRYLTLIFILTYRKPIMIFITLVGWTMLIISILYFLGFNMPVDSPPYFQAVFGFSVVAIIPFSIYRSVKRNFSSHGMLQEKIIYEFTDDKIKITGETFNSEQEWAKTYKITELKDWILVYQNRQVANIIPKESFGDRIIDFRSLVRNKEVKAKLK